MTSAVCARPCPPMPSEACRLRHGSRRSTRFSISCYRLRLKKTNAATVGSATSTGKSGLTMVSRVYGPHFQRRFLKSTPPLDDAGKLKLLEQENEQLQRRLAALVQTLGIVSKLIADQQRVADEKHRYREIKVNRFNASKPRLIGPYEPGGRRYGR